MLMIKFALMLTVIKFVLIHYTVLFIHVKYYHPYDLFKVLNEWPQHKYYQK